MTLSLRGRDSRLEGVWFDDSEANCWVNSESRPSGAVLLSIGLRGRT